CFWAMAWSSRRFLPTYVVVMAPYAARALTEGLEPLAARPPFGRRPWLRAAVAATSVMLAAAPGLATRGHLFRLRGERWAQYPGVCDFIARHGIRGRMFNVFHVGGYVLWRFWPQRLPFTDIHQAGTVADMAHYTTAIYTGAGWPALDQRYRFDHVLLDHHRKPD